MIKNINKTYKIKPLLVIIVCLFLIFVVMFFLLKINEEKNDELKTDLVEFVTKKLSYKKVESCVSYIEKAEAINYDTLLESEYSSTLYKYDSDEDNEYYLVCLTDIKYNDKDLTESIENKDLTIEELDTILKEQEVDSLKVVRDIKEVEGSQEEKDDEEDKKETTSSTDKTTSSNSSSSSKPSSSSSNSNKNNSTSSSSSSNSSSSSSNSKPSSGTTTSSKEEDNATLKKQLTAAGLSWDFNTKAEAEAFKTKWANRGFYAGYYINNYGDSDTAYSGYVEARPSGNCGTSEIFKVDWKNETSNMSYIWDYMQSLGYDCGW